MARLDGRASFLVDRETWRLFKAAADSEHGRSAAAQLRALIDEFLAGLGEPRAGPVETLGLEPDNTFAGMEDLEDISGDA